MQQDVDSYSRSYPGSASEKFPYDVEGDAIICNYRIRFSHNMKNYQTRSYQPKPKIAENLSFFTFIRKIFRNFPSWLFSLVYSFMHILKFAPL
jgi:hypothetical protein